MRVGFVGLGTMGFPMVKNLIRAGYEVMVVSRSRGPVEQACALGAREANNPKELAQNVDIALTCLPLPDTVEEIYFGENGLLAGAHHGLILADHSTVSPELNRKIYHAAKEKGAAFLDAPISGGPMGAEAGTLTIMCGGDPEVFDQAKPVFEAMGKMVVRVGESGSGSVVKLINNMLVGIHMVALSEAFVMGAKAGIDPELLRSIINASTGHSYMMDRTLDLIQDRDFTQRFSINLLYKDMKIATSLAEQLGVPLQLGKISEQFIGRAQQEGHGSEDVAAVIRPLERDAGVEVRRTGVYV
jgi:3-hydroxyisobutyrate dehydrogenase